MNKFIAVFVLLFIPWAFAQTNPDDLAPLVDLRNGGQAVGKANDGSLLGASLLAKEGEGYVRSSSDATSWGAGSMISLLENSSALYMQTYNPSVKIYIGDISLQTGGKYSPHSSHQNGLDVDVLYMGNKRYDSVFDKDGNGSISKEEIKSLLCARSEDKKIIEEIMKEVDSNGDGEISLNEFKEMMKKLVG